MTTAAVAASRLEGGLVLSETDRAPVEDETVLLARRLALARVLGSELCQEVRYWFLTC